MAQKRRSHKRYYWFVITYIVLLSALGSFMNDMYSPALILFGLGLIFTTSHTLAMNEGRDKAGGHRAKNGINRRRSPRARRGGAPCTRAGSGPR